MAGAQFSVLGTERRTCAHAALPGRLCKLARRGSGQTPGISAALPWLTSTGALEERNPHFSRARFRSSCHQNAPREKDTGTEAPTIEAEMAALARPGRGTPQTHRQQRRPMARLASEPRHPESVPFTRTDLQERRRKKKKENPDIKRRPYKAQVRLVLKGEEEPNAPHDVTDGVLSLERLRQH